jgi:hypothetical protein
MSPKKDTYVFALATLDNATHIGTIQIVSHHPMYPRQMKHSPEACHSEQDSTVFALATLETILLPSHHPIKATQIQLCLVAFHQKQHSNVFALATLGNPTK